MATTPEAPPHAWGASIPLSPAAWAANVLSMNDRPHYRVRATKTAFWRNLARLAARNAPHYRQGRVVVYFPVPASGRGSVREVANLQPVVKALVDGLVDAGVFTDDNDRVVWGQDARRLPPEAGGVAVRVVVEPGPPPAPPA